MATKTAIITVPNRTIRSGEYGASYGAGRSHEEILLAYLKISKSMAVGIAHEQDKAVITITYTGKLGMRNLEEIVRFYNHGFLLDLVY